jgi:hypothetical protein
MFKLFAISGAVLIVAAAIGCGSPDDTPVSPTIGTVATAEGTVMAAGSYIPLAGAVVSIGGVTLRTALDGTFAVSGLKPGDATLTVERQGFQKFSERVTLDGARTFNIFLSPSSLSRFAGSWKGTWVTGPKTGGLLMTLLVDTLADTVPVAFDVNGNIVGDYDPPGETYLGTISSGASAHFAQLSPVFGNVSADLSADGQITGRATGVPIANVSRFSFSGTVTSSTASIDYTITFNDNTTQAGFAILTR